MGHSVSITINIADETKPVLDFGCVMGTPDRDLIFVRVIIGDDEIGLLGTPAQVLQVQQALQAGVEMAKRERATAAVTS